MQKLYTVFVCVHFSGKKINSADSQRDINVKKLSYFGNVLYLDISGGYKYMYICKIHQAVRLRLVQFIVCKLHVLKK